MNDKIPSDLLSYRSFDIYLKKNYTQKEKKEKGLYK